MSASREKKNRQDLGAGYLSSKEQKALEEQKATRRTTVIFAVCSIAFVIAVVAMFLWNSGTIQRKAAAASVNGTTYTVADVAYYYYNARANAANSASLDANSSMRAQEYTTSEEFDTWYDYLADQAVDNLAHVELVAQAAKADGFDGGSEVNDRVNETLDSLKSSATANGYDINGYVKAVFGGLCTRADFERNLRNAALAEAYTNARSDVSGYSDAELEAQYAADPNTYSMVNYESLVIPASNYAIEAAEATDTAPAVEADDGTAAAKVVAEDTYARYQAGEKLEALAAEVNGTYSNTTTLSATGSDMATWLFDDARKAGDSAVLDYSFYGYSMGSVIVVFHSKERSDFRPIDVRHILVEDEAKANDLLSQFTAGAQTEDAFAALAQDNSTDTGSSENGGLYTGVVPGQMVQSFNDWCFDPARQSGDTGIVATDYGYHVMYFVGTHDHAYWQELAASKLAGDWADSLTANLDTQLLDGMKYIDR